MAHMRSQIRDAAHAALETGLSATVKRSRVYSVESATNIAYSISTAGVERVTQRTSTEVLRQCPVTVDMHAGGASDTLDDTLDDKCVLVEQTLSYNKLGGLVRSLHLETTEIELDGTGETAKGIARLTFMALYGTSRTDPETAA